MHCNSVALGECGAIRKYGTSLYATGPASTTVTTTGLDTVEGGSVQWSVLRTTSDMCDVALGSFYFRDRQKLVTTQQGGVHKGVTDQKCGQLCMADPQCRSFECKAVKLQAGVSGVDAFAGACDCYIGYDSLSTVGYSKLKADSSWSYYEKIGWHFYRSLANARTPSPYTGPSCDMTTGYGGYMYLEGSASSFCNDRYPSRLATGNTDDCKTTEGTTAALISPLLSLDPHEHCVLQFAWNMNGVHQGTLAVEVKLVSEDESKWHLLWSKSGDYGDVWRTATVSLVTHAGKAQVRFRAQRGANYRTDMAIDDLAFSSGCMEQTSDDGGGDVLVCGDGTMANAGATACVACPDQMVGTGGTCGTLCTATQRPDDERVACEECPYLSMAGINGTCVLGTCNDGFEAVPAAKGLGDSCAPCRAGMVGNGGNCDDQCGDGTQPASTRTKCEFCPTGMAGTKGLCNTKCESGEQPTVSRTACEKCPAPSIGKDGVCTDKCGDGSRPNKDAIACEKCPFPTVGTGGACATSCDQKGGKVPNAARSMCEPCTATTCAACEGGALDASTGLCVDCPAGTALPFGTDGPCKKCADGTQVNADRTGCEDCSGTYVGINGFCATQCTVGVEPGKDKDKCEPCAKPWVGTAGKCNVQCGDGSEPNAPRSACVPCAVPTVGTGGACNIVCGDGTEPSKDATRCETCSAPFYGTGGACDKRCGNGYALDALSPPSAPTCVACAKGTLGSGGICDRDPCGDGTQPNAALTVCVACAGASVGVGGFCDIVCGDGQAPSPDKTQCFDCEPLKAGKGGVCDQNCVADGTQVNALRTACEPCPYPSVGKGGVCDASCDGANAKPSEDRTECVVEDIAPSPVAGSDAPAPAPGPPPAVVKTCDTFGENTASGPGSGCGLDQGLKLVAQAWGVTCPAQDTGGCDQATCCEAEAKVYCSSYAGTCWDTAGKAARGDAGSTVCPTAGCDVPTCCFTIQYCLSWGNTNCAASDKMPKNGAEWIPCAESGCTVPRCCEDIVVVAPSPAPADPTGGGNGGGTAGGMGSEGGQAGADDSDTDDSAPAFDGGASGVVGGGDGQPTSSMSAVAAAAAAAAAGGGESREACDLSVMSPSATSSWGIGTVQDITWTGGACAGGARIELYRGSFLAGTIAVEASSQSRGTGKNATLTFTWYLPPEVVAGQVRAALYKVVVHSVTP